MDAPAILLAAGGHQLEAAETLVQAGRFVVILFAARALAELMVRLRLPAILGELVAGVLIGLFSLLFLTGVVLPFALGTFGLHVFFAVPLLPAIFAGAAMTATSIGITASVLGELKFPAQPGWPDGDRRRRAR